MIAPILAALLAYVPPPPALCSPRAIRVEGATVEACLARAKALAEDTCGFSPDTPEHWLVQARAVDCTRAAMERAIEPRLQALKRKDRRRFDAEMALQAAFNQATRWYCAAIVWSNPAVQEDSRTGWAVESRCRSAHHALRVALEAELAAVKLSVEEGVAPAKVTGGEPHHAFAYRLCELGPSAWAGGVVPPDCVARVLGGLAKAFEAFGALAVPRPEGEDPRKRGLVGLEVDRDPAAWFERVRAARTRDDRLRATTAFALLPFSNDCVSEFTACRWRLTRLHLDRPDKTELAITVDSPAGQRAAVFEPVERDRWRIVWYAFAPETIRPCGVTSPYTFAAVHLTSAEAEMLALHERTGSTVSPGAGGGCDLGENVSFMDLYDGRLVFLGGVDAPMDLVGGPSYPRKVRDAVGQVHGWAPDGWRLEQ